MLDQLSFEDFEPLLEEELSFAVQDDSFPLKLVKVVLAKHQPFADEEGHRRAFSLSFAPLDDRQYPQGNYLMTHPHYAEPMVVFMSPIMGRQPGTHVLQAVFS